MYWHFTLLIFCGLVYSGSLGQTHGFRYQAVACDANGALLQGQSVNVAFPIRQGAANGAVAYQKTYSPTTNHLGLFELTIGAGYVVTGDFAAIDWGTGLTFWKSCQTAVLLALPNPNWLRV